MSRDPLRAQDSFERVVVDDDDDRPNRSYKRLIVCCDGTWLDSDSDRLEDGKISSPSNVTRLTRAIRSQSSDGIQQIVYYQAGVGSTGDIVNRVTGGATGQGVAENVREAYGFITNNYIKGDEIFLIGFSRGAFTARSVGGLIGGIGVLTKEGVAYFPIIYKDFTHRYDKRYRSPEQDLPFRGKPPFRDPAYVRILQQRGLTRLDVRIKAVGVFDTVGSLGVPRVAWLGRLGRVSPTGMNEYAFYDTTLDNCIDNAFQALALDERRGAFIPSVWEKRGNTETKLVQVWFAGVHSNVGGSYADQELADITLAWMISMLQPFLDINLNYILAQHRLNVEYYLDSRQEPRMWSFGKIYNSVTAAFALDGTITRTPCDYYRTDPRTGEPTRKPLRDTHEYIHSSVRTRFVLHGPGYGDKGDYDPRALRKFRLRCDPGMSELPSPWFWENDGPEGFILPEAPLGTVERMLLKTDPEASAYLRDTETGTERARRRRRRSPGS